MKFYRPLLLREIHMKLPGLHVRRLGLNRHLPEVDQLREHSHPFHQILCYLSGGGLFSAGGVQEKIGSGSVVLVLPRVKHSFEEGRGRPALCLVLDVSLPNRMTPASQFSHLNLTQAAAIRRELSVISRLRPEQSSDLPLGVGASVLIVLGQLLEALGLTPPPRGAVAPFLSRINRVLSASHQPLLPISTIAQQVGYQADYLSRMCKAATGLTLREYRDEQLLRKARALLRSTRSIKEACAALGFDDQNYFARWFKKHTGQQPRDFAMSRSSSPVKLNHG